MERTTDSHTIRHRLTFTPNEVLAGLALLFPTTFRDLDEKRIDIEFTDGNVGFPKAEVSWDETRASISEQIHGISTPSILCEPDPQKVAEMDAALRKRFEPNDRVTVTYDDAYDLEGDVVDDGGTWVRVSFDNDRGVGYFCPKRVSLATRKRFKTNDKVSITVNCRNEDAEVIEDRGHIVRVSYGEGHACMEADMLPREVRLRS